MASNSSLVRALLTVQPKVLGGLPFSGKAAWKPASRAALTVPSAESPSQMNSSAPLPRPLSLLGNSFGGSDRFVPSPLAFEAARFAIDTLKESVPIWKQEHWGDRSEWSDAATPVRPVATA